MSAGRVSRERIPFPDLEEEGALGFGDEAFELGGRAGVFEADAGGGEVVGELAVAGGATGVIERERGAEKGGGGEREREGGEFDERVGGVPVGNVKSETGAAGDGAEAAGVGGAAEAGETLAGFGGLGGEVVVLVDHAMREVVSARGFEWSGCGTVLEAEEKQAAVEGFEAGEAEGGERRFRMGEGPELEGGANDLGFEAGSDPALVSAAEKKRRGERGDEDGELEPGGGGLDGGEADPDEGGDGDGGGELVREDEDEVEIQRARTEGAGATIETGEQGFGGGATGSGER